MRAILFSGVLAFGVGGLDAVGAIKTESIPDLKPPQGKLDEPVLQRERWPWFVAAACLTLSALLLWPKKTEPVAVEAPVAIARRALSEMRQVDPGALGAVLRNYISTTHSVPGPGQTFQQLAEMLERDLRWSPGLRQRFRKLADPIEIAKFAPGATPADLLALRDEALALIEDADALRRPPVPATR